MKCSGKRTFKEVDEEELEESLSKSPSLENTPSDDTTSYHYNSDGKEAPTRRGRGAA